MLLRRVATREGDARDGGERDGGERDGGDLRVLGAAHGVLHAEGSNSMLKYSFFLAASGVKCRRTSDTFVQHLRISRTKCSSVSPVATILLRAIITPSRGVMPDVLMLCTALSRTCVSACVITHVACPSFLCCAKDTTCSATCSHVSCRPRTSRASSTCTNTRLVCYKF